MEHLRQMTHVEARAPSLLNLLPFLTSTLAPPLCFPQFSSVSFNDNTDK